jgi:short-subunit dehydrogenase
LNSKKHLLILGADSDIAIAAAERFAREGWTLTLASRHKERTQNLCLELSEAYQSEASYICFNAMDTAAFIREYRERDIQANGILVAHALPEPPTGSDVTGESGGGIEQRLTDCRQVIQTNFTSVLELLETLKHDPSLRNDGFICAISSVAGLRGRASNAIYGSTKAALNSYMSGLRNELAGDVHVLTVLPGFVDTKMLTRRTPKWLTASPALAAEAIYRGIKKRKDVIYVKKIWYFIMLIIRFIPEKLFKHLNL